MALQGEKEKLANARRGVLIDDKKLTEALNNAEAVLLKVRNWRADFIATAIGFVDNEATAIGAIAPLPKAISTLPALEEAWANLREAVIADEPEKMDVPIAKVRERSEPVVTAAMEWKEAVEAKLKVATASWPAEARAALAERTRLTQLLGGIAADPPWLAPLLRSLQLAETELRSLVRPVRSALRTAAEAAARDVEKAAPSAAAINEAARRPPPNDGLEALADVIAVASLVAERVASAIAEAFPNHAAADRVKIALAEGNYLDAIAAARDATSQASASRRPQGTVEISGNLESAASTKRAAVPIFAPESEASLPLPAPLRWVAHNLFMLDTSSTSPVVARRYLALVWTRLALAALTMGALSFLTWGAYHETWVGSTNDFFAIGAAGLLSDLSLGSIFDLAAKTKGNKV
jgi:hypothetical protein